MTWHHDMRDKRKSQSPSIILAYHFFSALTEVKWMKMSCFAGFRHQKSSSGYQLVQICLTQVLWCAYARTLRVFTCRLRHRTCISSQHHPSNFGWMGSSEFQYLIRIFRILLSEFLIRILSEYLIRILRILSEYCQNLIRVLPESYQNLIIILLESYQNLIRIWSEYRLNFRRWINC